MPSCSDHCLHRSRLGGADSLPYGMPSCYEASCWLTAPGLDPATAQLVRISATGRDDNSSQNAGWFADSGKSLHLICRMRTIQLSIVSRGRRSADNKTQGCRNGRRYTHDRTLKLDVFSRPQRLPSGAPVRPETARAAVSCATSSGPLTSAGEHWSNTDCCISRCQGLLARCAFV